MKKVVIILAVVVLVCAAVASIPLVNNACASTQLRQMKKAKIPSQTVVLESECKVGRFVGTGDGTQYFSAMLVQSELAEEELRVWYEPYGYEVKQQIGQEISILERGGLTFDATLNPDKQYYIVYSLKDGIPPFSWLDIRGA